MVIPFRRTLWSSTTASGLTVGSDLLFNVLWAGLNADVGGFQLIAWAMDDEAHGTVRRIAGAEVSEDGKSWTAATLDPYPAPVDGAGVNYGGHERYTITDGFNKPYLRIGLRVQLVSAPAGSGVQTIEGRLTLIGESF